MSRYLTSSKVGLLALTTLYTESIVPSTATISVLSFLVSNVLPTVSSANGSRGQQNEHLINIEAFQTATINLGSGIPGRTIWDLFLNKLWKINSLDSLHDFFDGLKFLLQKTPEDGQRLGNSIDPDPTRMLLSRVSPLGAFVRRAQVEFARLQFHDAIIIWKNFVAYRAPTLGHWKKRNPAAGPTSFDTNLQADQLGIEDRMTNLVYGDHESAAEKNSLVSIADVEKLLDHQVERMQRIGDRLPQEIKSQLRAMIETGVTVPSLSHYIEFLDAWRAGDYPSSFDSLHRYFDYTMHNQDRAFYQYALLNLAILHADFDCHSEALTAIQETISSARENNDVGCLNYCLSWLYHFGKAHPPLMYEIQKKGMLGPERESVSFLKMKAKETGMWSLLTTSLLSEAKLTLTQGDSVSHAFENVLKASHINLIRNIHTGLGSQMMLQSSIFGRLGINCQSFLTDEIFLQCYARQTPVEDSILCIGQTVSMLSQKGHYGEAFALIENFDRDNLRPIKHHQLWTAQLGLLKLRHDIYRNHLVAADQVLAQLQAGAGLDRELHFKVSLLEIDVKIRRRDFSSSMDILEQLAKRLAEEEADLYHRIRLMTLKAQIFNKAGVPQKGFSIALRAASLAFKSKLLPPLWEAINSICDVFNSLSEFEASTKLLESVLPQVLECENCEIAAQTFSTLADSYVGLAGHAKAESILRKERLTKGLENLGKAFDEFSQIEDIQGQCEMMAKKATIMHLNGDPILANDCASKYLAIKVAAAGER